MTYTHPKAYKGANNQDVIRVMVEDNCLKCSEFMGKEHDFTECKPLYSKCPKPVKYPPLVYAEEFVKLERSEDE